MALTQQKRAAAVLAVLAFLVVAAATLTPARPAGTEQPIWCLACGDYATLDFLLNVVLFAPLGAALRVAGMAPRRVILGCALLSLAIELLQLRVVAGRDTSIADLIANVAGSGLGVLMAGAAARLLRPTPAQARRLAMIAAAVWLVVMALAALLVQPWRPAGWLNGQYVPVDDAADGFDGALIRARIDGDSIPVFGIPPSNPVARALRRDSVSLTVALAPSPPTPEPVAIVGIGAPRRGKIFGIAQDGSDALFRMRLRAEEAKLRAPSLRLTEGLRSAAPAAAPPILVRAGVAHRALFLEVHGAPGAAELVLPLTVGLGWTLLVPWVLRLTQVPTLANALWMAMLLLPLGYWAALGSRPRPTWTIVAAVVLLLVLGLGVLPVAIGAHATPVGEWLGAVAGLTLGAAAAARALRAGAVRPPD